VGRKAQSVLTVGQLNPIVKEIYGEPWTLLSGYKVNKFKGLAVDTRLRPATLAFRATPDVDVGAVRAVTVIARAAIRRHKLLATAARKKSSASALARSLRLCAGNPMEHDPAAGAVEERRNRRSEMRKINMGRVILGGVIAGVIINAIEGVMNGVILQPQWSEAAKAIGRSGAISAKQIVAFNVWDSPPESSPSGCTLRCGRASAPVQGRRLIRARAYGSLPTRWQTL
jgi:hypothetical protein